MRTSTASLHSSRRRRPGEGEQRCQLLREPHRHDGGRHHCKALGWRHRRERPRISPRTLWATWRLRMPSWRTSATSRCAARRGGNAWLPKERTRNALWASTSTKNPRYRDVRYVEELIGRDTVNTITPATLEAFRDHGQLRTSLDEHVEDAREVIDTLERAGISLADVTDRLVEDGVTLFSEAFDTLLAAVDKGRRPRFDLVLRERFRTRVSRTARRCVGPMMRTTSETRRAPGGLSRKMVPWNQPPMPTASTSGVAQERRW